MSCRRFDRLTQIGECDQGILVDIHTAKNFGKRNVHYVGLLSCDRGQSKSGLGVTEMRWHDAKTSEVFGDFGGLAGTLRQDGRANVPVLRGNWGRGSRNGGGGRWVEGRNWCDDGSRWHRLRRRLESLQPIQHCFPSVPRSAWNRISPKLCFAACPTDTDLHLVSS